MGLWIGRAAGVETWRCRIRLRTPRRLRCGKPGCWVRPGTPSWIVGSRRSAATQVRHWLRCASSTVTSDWSRIFTLRRPVVVDGRTVGRLGVADPDRHEWSADDLAGLSEAADVVSGRIQARLAEVEVARVQRLVASHNQVHDMIARAVPLHEVLTTACEAIERYDPSLMVSVLQRDPETNTLHSGVGPSFPQDVLRCRRGHPDRPQHGHLRPDGLVRSADDLREPRRRPKLGAHP